MWLTFALLSPLCWAFVHVSDSYSLDEILEKPWMGIFTGALATLPLFIPLPFLIQSGYVQISIDTLIFGIFIGFLLQISQCLYFKALSHSDAGTVSAYWNLVPALIPIASVFLLGHTFSLLECFGIIMLISASVVMCLLDANFDKKWITFGLMAIASLIQVTAILSEDHFYTTRSFLEGFYCVLIGIVLTGIAPLLTPAGKRRIFSNFSKIRKGLYIFFSIEVVNIFALFFSQRAIDLGRPSLVTAVESTVPAYVFILTYFFSKINHKYFDLEILSKWQLKMGLIIAMLFGVFIVSR